MYRNSRSNATQTRVSSVTGMPSSGSACTKFPAGSAPCHTASSSTPSTITGEVVGAAAISSRPSAPWRCGGLAPGADHPWARVAAGRAAPRQTQVVRVEYTRRNAILRNSGRLGSWGAADAGAPGRIRTSDPRLRRPLLCPPELRAPALQADQGRLVTQGSMTVDPADERAPVFVRLGRDRKSTRLNSSHGYISYAVFCLKKSTGAFLRSHPTTHSAILSFHVFISCLL